MHSPTRAIRIFSGERFRKLSTFARPLAAASLAVFFLAMCFVPVSARQAPHWPLPWRPYDNSAVWMIDVRKTAGGDMTDLYWADLSSPHATVGLGVRVTDINSALKDLSTMGDIQIRYFVHGIAVSPWIGTPFTYTLSIDNTALNSLPDGLHDISIDVQGSARNDYSFRPIYLHLARGQTLSPLVPIIGRDCMYCDYGFDFGPMAVYVNYADANRVGRPANPQVVPWHGDTDTEPDLYQEELAPHTDLFLGHQMWWEQESGAHTGAKYTRSLVPKWDEDHRGLRANWHHDRFPFRDGPRGIAWTSTYITGQVDSSGGFAFAEAGGPVRYMTPDGTVTTVVGWRVKPGKDPYFVTMPLSVIRQNEEFRGTFQSGRYSDGDGFRTPLDVAIDPQNERVWYVAGYEDNAIWRVDATDLNNAVVSVFAGDVNHSAGFSNGTGLSARFNGPASVVFDAHCDCMYVADQNNDAIRRISRAGVVTTLFGSPGQDVRQVARGVTTTDQYVIQAQNRTAAANHYEVTAADRANGVMPETYLPQTVRVDSQGNLVLLDVGFGAIRRINPNTLVSHHLGAVSQRFERNDEVTSSRGWAWMDVDRWGNAGPLDSIYFGAFQASWCDGQTDEHANEAYCWMPKEGAPAHFLFNDWNPNPDGWGARESTDPPHYNWLIAVDPRGAVLFAGGGEHGVTRMRKRRVTDPVPPNYFEYERAKFLWRYTTPSFALKFGWEGHSFLGFKDVSDYKDATDQQIMDAFEFPSDLRNNPSDLATVLMFMRVNGGKVLTDWTPVPPVTPPPNQGPPTNPNMTIDTPATNATVTQPFVIAGWALDAGSGATTGTGVDLVQIWACPNACNAVNGVFWGTADYGGARSDVGTAFGNHRFDPSGFGLTVTGRPAGQYQVVVYARSSITQLWQARVLNLTVSSGQGVTNPGQAYLYIDVPAAGSTVPGSFIIAGWAADTTASTGTGVDAVHIWACPTACNSTNAFFVGSANYGYLRPDVAAVLGNSRFTPVGFGQVVTSWSPGSYQIVIYAHSSATGQWRAATMSVTVQATPPQARLEPPAPEPSTLQPLTVAGWPIDAGTTSNIGIDAVHDRTHRTGGSPAVVLGAATPGMSRSLPLTG